MNTDDASTKDHERYQAFIENSSEGIWRVELEKPLSTKLKPGDQIEHMYQYGYLAEANDAMAKMYGFDSAKELLGARLGDLLVKEDPENIAYLKAFIQSGYRLTGVESHEIDKNQNDKYFQNSLIGIVEKDYLLRAWGTQQDVTEQHYSLDKLRRSEERLAVALKASQMGTWELDFEKNKLEWSDELKKLFGLPLDTPVTLELYQSMVHPTDREVTHKIVMDSLKTGEEYRIEHRVIWPDGSTHWILGHGKAIMKNGKATRLIGTAKNIDAQKKSEQDLKESEARFRTMADASPMLIWETDSLGKLTYVNKTWESFLGITPNPKALSNLWLDAMHPSEKTTLQQHYGEALQIQISLQAELRMRNKQGKYRWMLAIGTPRHNDDGAFIGYLGSCVDIHEIRRSQKLKAVNETLKKQRAQLVALNESKDEFISIASHQLRTPATGVKQYLGMLLEGYAGKLTKQQTDFLRTAYASNERQLTIIDDLLKVAHIDAENVAIDTQEADFVTLIQTVIKEQKSVFKERKQAVTLLHTKPRIIAKIDMARMRMVIENLLDNASKYSPDSSTITISVTETIKSIEVAIHDNGVGIAKKDQEKLFKKFSRINNPVSMKVGGTGIGLYWAKRVVDLHGGSIIVDSTQKKGTTFTIIIPHR